MRTDSLKDEGGGRRGNLFAGGTSQIGCPDPAMVFPPAVMLFSISVALLERPFPSDVFRWLQPFLEKVMTAISKLRLTLTGHWELCCLPFLWKLFSFCSHVWDMNVSHFNKNDSVWIKLQDERGGNYTVCNCGATQLRGWMGGWTDGRTDGWMD